jgi:hypothetical protein
MPGNWNNRHNETKRLKKRNYVHSVRQEHSRTNQHERYNKSYLSVGQPDAKLNLEQIKGNVVAVFRTQQLTSELPAEKAVQTNSSRAGGGMGGGGGRRHSGEMRMSQRAF